MLLQEKGESINGPQSGNSLIDSLPPRLRLGVLAQCDRVELAFGTVLCTAGEPFKYAYFPIAGNISLGDAIEPRETVGIGSEGMLGATLMLKINRAPQRGTVQVPCLALRITARRMRVAILRNPVLYRTLQFYLHFFISELSQAKGCVRFHNAGKRLARGLLLAHDRARTGQLPITHQLLANTLGVQRGAITIAAIKLQREGIIRYSRGKITVLDRHRLEASSCGFYSANIRSYPRAASEQAANHFH